MTKFWVCEQVKKTYIQIKLGSTKKLIWPRSMNIIWPLVEENITISREEHPQLDPIYLHKLSSIYYEPTIKIYQTHKETAYHGVQLTEVKKLITFQLSKYSNM